MVYSHAAVFPQTNWYIHRVVFLDRTVFTSITHHQLLCNTPPRSQDMYNTIAQMQSLPTVESLYYGHQWDRTN